MDHPDNTLNNITSIFAWKPIRYLFASVPPMGRGRLFYLGSLPKFKNWVLPLILKLRILFHYWAEAL